MPYSDVIVIVILAIVIEVVVLSLPFITMLFVSYYLPQPIMLSIYLLDFTYKMSPLSSVSSISLLIAQFSSMSHLCQLSKLLSLSIQVVYS